MGNIYLRLKIVSKDKFARSWANIFSSAKLLGVCYLTDRFRSGQLETFQLKRPYYRSEWKVYRSVSIGLVGNNPALISAMSKLRLPIGFDRVSWKRRFIQWYDIPIRFQFTDRFRSGQLETFGADREDQNSLTFTNRFRSGQLETVWVDSCGRCNSPVFTNRFRSGQLETFRYPLQQCEVAIVYKPISIGLVGNLFYQNGYRAVCIVVYKPISIGLVGNFDAIADVKHPASLQTDFDRVSWKLVSDAV